MSARLQAPGAGVCIVIDDLHDCLRASDRFSRFGAYLAMRLPAVLDEDPDVLTDPVRWAAFAWATATTPVMSPGYVEWSDPIEDIQIGWDDGDLVLEGVLRAHLSVNLPGWRGWGRDLHGNLVEPWHGNRTALARVALRAVLMERRLPSPPDASSRDDVVFTAKAAVSAVALAIEEVLVPVVAALADRDQGLHLEGPDR